MKAVSAGTPPEKISEPFVTKGYHFIDYATQLYLAVVGLLILFFHNHSLPQWPYLLCAHATVIISVHILIRTYQYRPESRPIGFFRHFYPILLYPGLYRSSEALNRMFVDDYLDDIFIRLEQYLFGFQPSVEFMEALSFRIVSELFYLSYFSYYIMIIGIGTILYLQEQRHFFHYVSIISFIFYVCFLVYIFSPVIGPPVFYTQIPDFNGQEKLPFYPLAFPQAVESGLFYKIMKVIYRYFEGHGAAFPSSHVAVAIGTLYFTWRYLPYLRWLHLITVLLLSLSTVYCRYHYAVDVFAGAITAAILLPLGDFIYKKVQKRRSSA